jgi:hypothetical protein
MKPVSTRSRLVALFVFAAAMGWLEGVVVVYIRALIGLERGRPIPLVSEVMQGFHALPWLLGTEQSREAATLIMLGAVAWITARTWRGRIGALLVSFGTWDIVYYVALYVMLGWPKGLGDKDVLFLIPPGPWWHQPVWVPIAISAGMIVVGVRMVIRGERGAGWIAGREESPSRERPEIAR